MKMQIVLTEDDVDRILLKWLTEEYSISTTRRGIIEPKHYVTLEWTRCPVIANITNEPSEHHKDSEDFSIDPIGG